MAADREAAKAMMEKTGQMGVPAIIIDDKDIVIGFDRNKLSELLGLNS